MAGFGQNNRGLFDYFKLCLELTSKIGVTVQRPRSRGVVSHLHKLVCRTEQSHSCSGPQHKRLKDIGDAPKFLTLLETAFLQAKVRYRFSGT